MRAAPAPLLSTYKWLDMERQAHEARQADRAEHSFAQHEDLSQFQRQPCDEKAPFFFPSHLFASTSVVRRVWGTYVSRLLRQPATTPAGWGLFAGCPRATHPTAPLGRQMGRWAPRWAARGASRRAPGALRTRDGLSSAGSRPGERPLRTTAPAGEPLPVRAVARTSGCCG